MDTPARRLRDIDSSAIREAFAAVASVSDLIDLSVGYPIEPTPTYIKQAGAAAIRNNQTRYTPAAGTLELRSALAKKLRKKNKVHVPAEAVAVTPGLTVGILMAYMATLNPGDEVLVPDPYFPAHRDAASAIGAKAILVDTFPDFQLTAAKLTRHIGLHTKAVVINSPNNPTGAVYPEAELKKIAVLANKHKLLVFSDEIYENFVDGNHFSIGSVYPNTVTMSGFSKAYAMTGWRIGYLAGPIKIINAVNQLQQHLVFSASSIGQAAALAALKKEPAGMAKKYRQRRQAARKILGKSLQVSQGAFFGFVRVPKKMDDRQFCQLALRAGVLILPGSAFSDRRDYVRVSFTAEPAQLESGLTKIRELLEARATA